MWPRPQGFILCRRELGFLPVEVNASDTRNKSDKSALKGIGGKLSNGIRELATNTAISKGPDGKPARVRCDVTGQICYIGQLTYATSR